MAFVVSLAGMGVAGVGLLGVAAPRHLVTLLARWRALTGFLVTLALRLGFGVVFIAAAPSCRFPGVVRAIGVLELLGAAGLVTLGSARLGRFVEWWLSRPPSFVRCWCLVAFTVGALLAYAGAWKWQ